MMKSYTKNNYFISDEKGKKYENIFENLKYLKKCKNNCVN
jgi:hypothetical protein